MKYSQVNEGEVFYIEGSKTYPKLKIGLGHKDLRDGCHNHIGNPDWEVELASSEVKLTYFKENGKYYTEGSYYFVGDLPYHEILHRIAYWESHFQVPLPGLSSSKWNGYILVIPQREDLKVPHLLSYGDTLTEELFKVRF